MNLKGLFKRLTSPQKVGADEAMTSSEGVVTKAQIQLANIEGNPIYDLEEVLIIGREVGDIVIEDPSLSPRHASFEYKSGVVTVTDHSQKTSLAGNPLKMGKATILQNGDELLMGDIVVRVLLEQDNPSQDKTKTNLLDQTVLQSSSEAPPAGIPTDKPQEMSKPEEAPKEIPAESQGPSLEMQKRIQKMRGKGKVAPQEIKVTPRENAANALTRVVGMILDLLLVLTVWNLLSPYDEFRLALEAGPDFLYDHIWPLIVNLFTNIGLQNEFKEGIKQFIELISEAENTLSLSYIVSLFFSWRIMTALLVGVSLGSFLSGIRPIGNLIWKRVGGGLREVIGLFTLPLVIFDLPAIFSKRTLKEMITYTQVATPSKFIVIVSWILYLPLCALLFVVSPVFSGLEIPEGVVLHQELKPTKKFKGEQLPVEVTSTWMGVSFGLLDDWKTYPVFTWTQQGKTQALNPTIIFEHKEISRLELTMHKRFDLTKLLRLALAHNPLIQNNFPTLWAYVQSSQIKANSNLKSTLTQAQVARFQGELQELVASALGLSWENGFDFIMTHGPILNGVAAFKKSLIEVMQSQEGGEWVIKSYGKTTALVYTVAGVKSHDIVWPMTLNEGKAFRINYPASANRIRVNKVADSTLWANSKWKLETGTLPAGLLRVIDLVSEISEGKDVLVDAFESAYGAFFEEAQALIRTQAEDSDPKRILFLESLQNVKEVLRRLHKKKLGQEVKDNVFKLHEKLTELTSRFESKQLDFFNPAEG